MPDLESLWRITLLLVILLSAVNYGRGWLQLRSVWPGLANGWRLLAYLGFTPAMIAGLVWPLPSLTPTGSARRGNW